MRTSLPQEACLAWQGRLGEAHVRLGERAAAWLGPGTGGFEREVLAVLSPASEDEVVETVRIAGQHGIPLYPISGGRNWGYGDNRPAADGCVVVDLSRMDRVLELDEELGLVTVEPGVTQAWLAEYLDTRDLPFLVPTSGAGPLGSLLGNALERGIGAVPVADHFLGLTALRAVLPDGTIYRSALSELGAELIDQAHKWGFGPYLDGLFSQGAFGIVTRGTIALVRKPERYVICRFEIARDDDLEDTLVALRSLQGELAGCMTAVGVSDRIRVLADSVPFPFDRVPSSEAMPPELVAELANTHHVAAWATSFFLHGPSEVVEAAQRLVARRIEPLDVRLQCLQGEELEQSSRLLAQLPAELLGGQLAALAAVPPFGRPQDSLNVAYWRTPDALPAGGLERDPGRDGAGFRFYSPLIPFKPALVREHLAMVRRICREHGLDPAVRLLLWSPRVINSTVPLLYDRRDPAAVERARACWEALLLAGRQAGFLPYRASGGQLGTLMDPEAVCWRLVARIKGAIDPAGIVAPGRYVAMEREAGGMSS